MNVRPWKSAGIYLKFLSENVLEISSAVQIVFFSSFCIESSRIVELLFTTESENRLQLDSLLTSVNVDRLTMVDNTSAVGNDSCPWVVPQSIKWLSTITRERRSPLYPESDGFPHLFGTFLSPHIGSAWRAHHDNNNNNKLFEISNWIE